MTTLCQQHAPDQAPYELLWGPQGFVIRAIRAQGVRGRLTRATASAALRQLRQAFQLAQPANRHPKKTRPAPATAPTPAPASAPATPEPEVPRVGPSTVPPLPGISPLRSLSQDAATPPPMPEDDNESDISATGVVMNLFARPFLPLMPVTSKFKAIRAAGLAAYEAEEKKRKAAETRRLNKEKKEAAILARKKREEEAGEDGDDEEEDEDEEGLGPETKKEIANDIANAAAKAASRVAKRKWAHLLEPARRGVVTRRVKAKAAEAVLKTI
ncbi:hypothetical protein LZ32DRAFT_535646 [Colletotrichum eremochloae]|nr:hypothetical protein LZ32DRAFT_535646 [Colletotrichum eremochloae]